MMNNVMISPKVTQFTLYMCDCWHQFLERVWAFHATHFNEPVYV